MRASGRGGAWLKNATCGAALFVLAACTVQLVPPYDQVVDDGLVSFNRGFLQFMAQIKEEVPAEAASYANNTSFYNTQQANIGTLVQRSQAADPKGSCPGTALAEEAVRKIDAIVLPAAETSAGSAAKPDRPPVTGSCMTLLLTNIRNQLTDTACFHQVIYGQTSGPCEARGFTESVANSLQDAPLTTKLTLLDQIQEAVTASVTAAMTLELAKRQGTEQGGS